jgi:hypothetical protein
LLGDDENSGNKKSLDLINKAKTADSVYSYNVNLKVNDAMLFTPRINNELGADT